MNPSSLPILQNPLDVGAVAQDPVILVLKGAPKYGITSPIIPHARTVKSREIHHLRQPLISGV